MQDPNRFLALVATVSALLIANTNLSAQAQIRPAHRPENESTLPQSAQYRQVQQRLAQGWNTWDVHSVTTHVLLPEGLAIHIGLKHNTTENGEAFLGDALIGRLNPGAEQVTPGPHSWNGSYTDLRIDWRGHGFRVQSAHDGDDLALLVTPLPSKSQTSVPPTIVFLFVGNLWNRHAGPSGFGKHGIVTATGMDSFIEVDCTCWNLPEKPKPGLPVASPYFAVDLTGPVGISTSPVGMGGESRRPRTLDQIRAILARQKAVYDASLHSAGRNAAILDAIETTIGWDTIYEPEKERVISPVSRVWSVDWGGYVLFDWDTFFAATMAGIGDKDLAYANALEILREETAQGFVPNYARAGTGTVPTDPSRRWARSLCSGFIKNSTTDGLSKTRSSRC